MTFIDFFKRLAKRKGDGISTFPQVRVVTDKYDAAAGKAIMAAHRALGRECSLQELANTMATALWWVQTTIIMDTGDRAADELSRFKTEQSSTENKEDQP